MATISEMPNLLAKAHELSEYCQAIHKRGLVSACGGNVSLRLPEGKFLLTPSGYALNEVTPDDLVLLDSDGVVLNDTNNRPTSELHLHLKTYNLREDINAVVHTHSPAATSFAFCGKEIKPVNPESMICLKVLPLVPYFQYGSLELAAAASAALTDANAVLLEKHGVVTAGRSLREAVHLAELVEETALMNIYIKMIARGE